MGATPQTGELKLEMDTERGRLLAAAASLLNSRKEGVEPARTGTQCSKAAVARGAPWPRTTFRPLAAVPSSRKGGRDIARRTGGSEFEAGDAAEGRRGRIRGHGSEPGKRRLWSRNGSESCARRPGRGDVCIGRVRGHTRPSILKTQRGCDNTDGGCES
jgi:hypothetical protein